ncbi:MAG: hypothetical protein OHK0053_13220 [Microscillaceae bacterium]
MHSFFEEYSGIIFGLSGGLTAFLMLYWQWRRPNRKRRALRLVLSLLALLSLFVWAYAPGFWQTRTQAQEGILLTPGFSADSLALLLKKGAVYPAFALPSVNPLPPGFDYAPDLMFLRQSHPEIRQWHVLGEGLPPHLLEQATGMQLRCYFSALPSGIASFVPPARILEGEYLEFAGICHHPGPDTLRLFLRSPGEKVDSVRVESFPKTAFRLSDRPKATGQFLYTLEAINSRGNIVFSEKVAVEVLPRPLLKVGLYNSYPDAERNYLKNYLADQGASVLVQSTLSTQKTSREQINAEAPGPDFAPEALAKLDVVLMDVAFYQSLGNTQKAFLQEAIANGLGLLLLPEEASLAAGNLAGFRFSWQPLPGEQARLNDPEGNQPFNMPVMPYHFIRKPGQKAIWQDEAQKIRVLAYPVGQGQVGMSLMGPSFPLSLEGKKNLYEAFWLRTLRGLARRPLGTYLVKEKNFPARVDERLQLMVHNDQAFRSARLISPQGAASLGHPQADIWGRARVSFDFFSTQAGWHTFQLDEDSTRRKLYVQEAGAWATLHQAQKQTYLRHWKAKQNQDQEKSAALPAIRVWQKIPAWIFFLVFLLCMGGLWLEERL